MKNSIKSFFSILREVINIVLIAMVIAVIIKLFFFQVYYITSSSMENTLKKGDQIIVFKFLYGNNLAPFNIYLPIGIPIKRGDIIVFRSPISNNEDFVKRCIGIPGDDILIKENYILINGRRIEEKYLKTKNVRYRPYKIHIKKGYIFVMGDNRNNSVDSREWGLLPIKNVIGKAILLYYPFYRFRFL